MGDVSVKSELSKGRAPRGRGSRCGRSYKAKGDGVARLESKGLS